MQKTKDFVIVPTEPLLDKRLSLKAKGLLSLVLSLPEEWDCSPTELCAFCHEEESEIDIAAEELRTMGYIVVS